MHRKYPFLSNIEVQQILNYLIESFCYFKTKNESYFGWGSLSVNVNHKQPIPIITCYALLALYGVHYCNSRLSKLFELSLLWLLKVQKPEGYWEEGSDYCTNMFIICALSEIKNGYKQNRMLSNCIQKALDNAKEFYNATGSESVPQPSKPFFYIIAKYLGINIMKYDIPDNPKFIQDYKCSNRVYGEENFSYQKSSLLYYLFLATIDDTFYEEHYAETENFCKIILSDIKDNGFWRIEDQDGDKDCVWLTCDVLNTIISLGQKRYWQTHSYYNDICNYTFDFPWYIKAIQAAKFLLKARKPLNTTLKTYRNWFSDYN